MALRGTQPVTIKPQGLSDAVDGTNAFAGAMAVLQDLIPNPSTRNQFVPRPASTQVTNFSGFTTPANGEALLVVGTRAYGFIASARFAGKSEPFCYDLVAGAFVAIANVTASNTPTTASTSGDWTPPGIAAVTNSRIMLTHPGYDGVTYFLGWIDISSFSSAGAATGDTHTSTTIDTLSVDVITTLGWQVGYKITGSGIPANTYITSINAAGTSITISNATTTSVNGVSLTVTGGTSAAPVYNAGNTAPIALTARANAVAQFNGRAYYAVGNGATFSDPLTPTQVSGGGGTYVPTLTFGDNTFVTAFGGTPLTSQLSGGVIQALIVFKGGGPYWQLTGDAALTNNPLTSSEVAGSMGTLAPNTVCATPAGLAYVAQDGLRIIGQNALSSQPVGQYGGGVCVPFVNAVAPSRMCAAYNHNVVRISVQNGAVNGQPVQEYWYDLGLQIWTGPHSFPASLISNYDGTDDTFIMFAAGVNAKLFQSDVWPTPNSTYVENGNNMSWVFEPTLSPDNAQTAMNSVIWSLIGFALPSSQAITIIAMNEQGVALDTINFAGGAAAGSIWDSFDWGAATWGASNPNYQQYQLDWHLPLVFKQISFRATGQSIAGFIVGDQFFRYKPEGYPTP